MFYSHDGADAILRILRILRRGGSKREKAGLVGFSCRVIWEPDIETAVFRFMESKDYREMSGLSGLLRESKGLRIETRTAPIDPAHIRAIGIRPVR